MATGRWSAAGVAAAVGKLRRLGPKPLAAAIAIAEAQAPNLLAADHSGFTGGDTKEGIPWSVLAGIAAVDQAALGLQGYRAALDNPDMYVPGAAALDFGTSFLVETTYFKLYGCCRWTHSAIDAILEMRRGGVEPHRVDTITIATFQRALNLKNMTRPTDVIAAQFSLPFGVAVALVEGPEALLLLNPSLLTRRDVIQVAERIHLELDHELDAYFPAQVGARVTLLAGTEKLEREVRFPRGDPANPLSDEGLIRKSVTLFGGVRAEDEVRSLVQSVFTARPASRSGGVGLMKSVLSFLRGSSSGLGVAP